LFINKQVFWGAEGGEGVGEELEGIVRNLLLSSSVHDVTNSIFPVLYATKLAGYQMQVTYGDHNANIHVPGFLTFVSPSSLSPLFLLLINISQ
jgi:hypothetical protein